MGKECSRDIFYGFRWASKVIFDARMQRLFGRGHMEESRFVRILQSVGSTVWTKEENGDPIRATFPDNLHLGGSADAVAQGGVPEIPEDEVFECEFKTANQKNFDQLQEQGLVKAKWQHYVQAQVYMGALSLRWGLYMAINKNTDDLFADVLQFDESLYNRTIKNASTVSLSPTPPKRVHGASPTWWKCRFCDHHAVCHTGAPPLRSCRTCHFAYVNAQGWECRIGKPNIKGEQSACEKFTPARWD